MTKNLSFDEQFHRQYILEQESEQQDRLPQSIAHCEFALVGVLLPTIGAAGIVGNIISFVVLATSELHLKPTFIQLLKTLIVFDSLCILSGVMIFSVSYFSTAYSHFYLPYMVPYLFPLGQIALTGSVYTTMAVAIERYLSICHPTVHLPPNVSYFSVAAVVFISVIANISRFFEFEVVPLPVADGGVLPLAMPTSLRTSRSYSIASTVCSLVWLHVVPLAGLAFLNLRIWLAVRSRRNRLSSLSYNRRRDLVVAAVLLLIVVVFLVCHSVKCVINVVELASVLRNIDPEEQRGPAMNLFLAVSHLLVVTNSSVNFVLYCYKDKKFRNAFIKVVYRNYTPSRSGSEAISMERRSAAPR